MQDTSQTKKIQVGILGATGMVGQQFVSLLAQHPWFDITALAASDRSIGKRYGDISSKIPAFLPKNVQDLILLPCQPSLPCQMVFSALASDSAGEIEKEFADKGYPVISNASHYRMHPQVPLLIPEVNPDHLNLISHRKTAKGTIVTNPNCSVTGISMALKPLVDLWGVESLHITTMQAISGAGYPGVSSIDILDNVIPYIKGEEEKIETEILKIFGHSHTGGITPYPLSISAHCNRVPVMDGHLACLSFKLKKRATQDEIISAWKNFQGEPQILQLPTAPSQPLIYLDHDTHPQPKLHRHLGQGMSVSIGRLRKCSLFDWKCVVLSHNTVRGAAGCAILNAELMREKGYFASIKNV